ncbi:MAG: hypothetical protein IIZ93_11750 [Acidaminococcaceae bacterium]|nr:hypothetical protein [Acidaminococcaceae bacterium]
MPKQKKVDGDGEAASISAIKLPVAGFRRRVAAWPGRGQGFAARRQTGQQPLCQPHRQWRRFEKLRHWLPPLEKHPVDASGRAHGPTAGRDTTACFAGGE